MSDELTDMLRELDDSSAALLALDPSTADPELCMEALVRFDRAARRRVGLASCSRCGEMDYIKHGRFHQRFYSAQCGECLYFNIRPIPEGLPA